MTKTVNLTIDETRVTVPEGTLVVDAAKQAGIDIPVFCYHPKMEPVGMCRMCLVEVGRPVIDRASGQVVLEDGQPKIQFLPKLETACTNTVSEGMVVRTQRTSEKAREGQHDILEFLLTSHPLDCPICDKGGECPLQNLTMAHGPGKSRFPLDEKYHLAKHYPLGELIVLDRERCIQCGRCIRFQDEIVGEAVLGFEDRGRGTQIISTSEPGFDSIFSGNTTDICPVGALTTTDFRFGARPWELLATPSICSQCPVGCNTTINSRREAMSGGEIVIKRMMPRQNEEVNEIWICDKGRLAYHYTGVKERLAAPLLRGRDGLEASSWDAALDKASALLSQAPQETVFLASGRLSNEDLYNMKSLAAGLGAKTILYSDMAGGEVTTQVGMHHGTNLGALGKGDAILVVASDLHEEAPIWYLRVKQAADRGATLVVANSRLTRLDRHARFVIRYVNGDESKAISDLQGESAIAKELSAAGNLVIFFGSDGLGLQGTGELAAACGSLLQKAHAGKANSGVIAVWPRANDEGAWELGFRPVPDLASALKDKTVYIAGADPAGDDPALAGALKSAKAVIVQEILRTATADLAEVVLPAQAYTEREGTYTSGERRVQRFYRAVPPLGSSREDFAILGEVGKRLGQDLEYRTARLVFDRLAANTPKFAGLTYEWLAQVKPQWPMVGRSDMYYGGTTYENRHGLGVHLGSNASGGEQVNVPAVQAAPALRPSENELLAVPVTRLYDLGLTVQTSSLLSQRIGRLTVALHPETAKRLGVEPGSRVKLSFDGVSGEALVTLDDTISAGVALVPRSMGLPIHGPAPLKVN